MLKPTPHMIQTLADLWHATGGKPNQFVKVENLHHGICSGLHDRNLCTLEEKKENGRKVRYLAFTETGKNFAILKGINDMKPVDLSLMPRSDERERISISIQLNLSREDHLDTLARVQRLKSQKQFTPTFCKLMALWDKFGSSSVEKLLNGQSIDQALKAEREALERAKANISEAKKRLEEQQAEIDRQWEELEAERAHDETILNMQDKLIRLEGLLTSGAVQKPQAIPQPSFDEDDDLLEVKKDEAAGDKAVQNFLQSAMGLQGIELPKPVDKPQTSGPKQLDVPTFSTPSFDDEDDDINLNFNVAVGD